MGIRQAPDTAGYTSLIIEPKAVSKFEYMRGSIETPNGTVEVAYRKENDGIHFEIAIPEKTEAVFIYDGAEYPLSEGESLFTI